MTAQPPSHEDERRRRRQAGRTAADAALGTPGVAYLSPGPGSRLTAALHPGSVPGVRVTADSGTERRMEISIATRAGTRAATTARAVRHNVERALRQCHPAPASYRIEIVVTAIV
ncbi:hypothetical protein [Kitasatospora sp. LaBMicrA B282]|uniref:hypothetical protein n=1 Tax=Kitasatospora sp. LaBMicrA B282 TaxID=3420949 RepID=UPI003D0A0280